jgi:hypothetical protein
MSSVTDERIVGNSSTYHLPDSYSSNKKHITTMNTHTGVNINDLIQRIMSIVDERLDDAQQHKICLLKIQSNLLFIKFYVN